MKIQGNERDIEIPLLKNWLTRMDGSLRSVLEVGCAFSQYTKEIKPLCGQYHGIDLLFDVSVSESLDQYIVGDFLFEDLPAYDLIFAVSVLEHIGVEYLPTKMYKLFQEEALSKMIDLARAGVFATFPYGENILFERHYYNWNRKFLDDILKLKRVKKYLRRFYSASDPSKPDSWQEISQDQADKGTQEMGNRVNTICVLEVYK